MRQPKGAPRRAVSARQAAQRTDHGSLRSFRGREVYDGGEEDGPLTRAELEMLQEQCGYEFSWPPKQGESYPTAARYIAFLHLAQARRLVSADTFAEIVKQNQVAMRMNGEVAFDDAFLRAAARVYEATSPTARIFLAGGGQSPLYA
ncbi:MAG: hypothetical protein Q4P32_02860 [Micrococcales bacterium]|nr:hypothetical protein [Micrococcales bacterium]